MSNDIEVLLDTWLHVFYVNIMSIKYTETMHVVSMPLQYISF